MTSHRVMLAGFALALVAVAFMRAGLFSSTGIIAVGDAADYQAIAESEALVGRAPFVYRPLVPLIVGALFPGHLGVGFAIFSACAMFSVLYHTGRLAGSGATGYLLAATLFLNYQVLFAAAYPARLDIAVLAVQLLFVRLALEDRPTTFLWLLPMCALLKESTLLGLGALALVAFDRSRVAWWKLALSGSGFLAIHAIVRLVATPTASMPPYATGVPLIPQMMEMAADNLSLWSPLSFVVAWGGLCAIAAYLALGQNKDRPNALALLIVAFLLAFPIPLVTDLHRAWFELLAPVVLFHLLSRIRASARGRLRVALGLALGAGLVPYLARAVADEHLYLLILEHRSSGTMAVALAATLLLAVAGLESWRTEGAATDPPG